MTSALAAGDRHAGDTDQNSILWFGVPSIAPEAFRRSTFLRSPRLIFDGNISPDSVPYGVCTEWNDERTWAVLLEAEEEEEQEQISAAPQQMEEEKNREGGNGQP